MQATQQATTQDKLLLSIALNEIYVALGQPTTQVAAQVGKLLRAAAERVKRASLETHRAQERNPKPNS